MQSVLSASSPVLGKRPVQSIASGEIQASRTPMKMLPESIRKKLGLQRRARSAQRDGWLPVSEQSRSRRLSAPARWLCGVTDIGQRRSVNEDEYFLSSDCTLWVVADGMGGHAAGAVASALTIHAIVAYFYSKT